MKKITLFFVTACLSNLMYSQCIENTQYPETTITSTNSGFVQQIANNNEAGEYAVIGSLISGHNYRFTSTKTATPNNDYITITTTSNTVIAHGISPLTVNSISSTTIRMHISLNSSCTNEAEFRITTIQDLTNAPTCYAPISPLISYLSNSRIDFSWSPPVSSTPSSYDWEIVPSGNAQGVGVITSGTTSATNASSGEVLTTSTAYSIFIRSDCGASGKSIYLGPLNITTLSAPPPANDFCSGAISIIQETNKANASLATPTAGTLLGGAGTNIVAESCNGPANARDDVWYSFVAQTTNVKITLEPSGFNGILTLYSGNCNALVYLSCSDSNGGLDPRVEEISYSSFTIGQTYYTRAYSQGFSTSSPAFNIKIWSISGGTDADGDGFSNIVDCNDNDNTIYPGATELCDGKDNDCDASIDEGLSTDADGDGHYAIGSCETPADDCNDNDNTIYPGAPELCDGKDNDCDASIDEGITFTTYYRDLDNDGYGNVNDSTSACDGAPTGYVTNATDCNDNDNTVYPGAPELCDGKDNDCDTLIDEGLSIDADGDGFYSIGSCASPATDCNDNDNTIYPGAPELCDGKDNDCDGSTDEGITFITYYRDIDNDGYGNVNDSTSACDGAPTGYVSNSTDCNDNDNTVYPGATELCDGKDNDCDTLIDEGLSTDADGDGHYAAGSCATPADDCDDSDPDVYPGAPELCDGKDNDCDSVIDEGLSTDADGDGHYAAGSCATPADDCDDSDPDVYPGAPELCDGKDNDCDSEIDEGLSTDADGDGHYAAGSCATPADDCDDSDPDVYPGAPELCDGKDNDCDSVIDEGLSTDADGDGHYAAGSCATPADDCDDSDPDVYPGAPELCDGKDNDCDTLIDEGLSTDADGDGHYAAGSCATPADDCDDSDPDVYPGAPELCDGKDNDCDSVIDEGLSTDADGDGHYAAGSCATPADDCDDSDPDVYPGAPELCDGKDNDCDSVIDEGLSTDADGDGHYAAGSCATPADDCDDSDPDVYPGAPELCDGKDNDCDASVDEGLSTDADGDGFYSVGSCASPATDCNDNDNTIYPGAPELCDGKDNDCDGSTDEGITFITYYRDIDNDGYGNVNDSATACDGAPTGYVTNATDCNDNDNTVYPGAPELCDGKDNDCDASIDEGLSTDADGDGFYSIGSCASPATDCNDNDNTIYPGAPELCDGKDNDCDASIDEGLSTDADGDGFYSIGSCASPATDCNDNDNTIYPGAPELCDGKDNDCDGSIDEGLSTDADGDGFYSVGSCVSPATDCNDNDNTIYQGAPELCDGKDNDCDGSTDEGITFITYYRDIDNDGYGNVNDSTSACDGAPTGYVSNSTDCNDNDNTVYPGATELCDGKDNDCDASIDEGLSTDADGDGFYSIGSCASPATDCNDNDNTIYPGAPELCDGKDNDCDGSTDEGLSIDADGDGHYAIGSCATPADDCDDSNSDINPNATDIPNNGIDEDCDGSDASIIPEYLNDFSNYPGEGWVEAIGTYANPSGTSSDWTSDDFGNNAAHLNGQSAKVNINGVNIDEYLISPLFDLSDNNYYLNFDIALTAFEDTKATSLEADDYVVLLVTEDDWNTFMQLKIWDSNSTIGTSRQASDEIELVGYGTNVRFAFYAFSDTANSNVDFFIDNFQITSSSLKLIENRIEGFKMYPNPIKDRLNFRASEIINTITVYTLVGQEIISIRPSDFISQIDTSKLSSGIYIVKVQVGDKVGSYRIIKR